MIREGSDVEKTLVVVGTRPEAVKLCPLVIPEFDGRKKRQISRK